MSREVKAWGKLTANDGTCEARTDGRHGEEWWDDEGPCLACGYDGALDNENGTAKPQPFRRTDSAIATTKGDER